MELALKKEAVAYCGCVFEKSVKQNLDLGWNLPDYCGEIRRILYCSVTPCVNGVSVGGGRVSAAGEIQVRLVYLNEQGQVDVFFETAELAANAEIPQEAQDARMLALAAVDYVNPRAASARRFTLSGAVSVLFRAFSRKTESVLCEIENCGGQTKCETLQCLSLLSCAEKTFDLSETVELPEDVAPIEKLLRTQGTLRTDSLKAVSGKLLLRGELIVKFLYLAGGGTGEILRYEHRMPISQIIEVPDLTEESLCETALHLQCLQVHPRADSTGALRLADVQSQISVFVKAFEQRAQTVVTDCYATELPLRAQKRELSFCSRLQSVDRTVQMQTVPDLGETKVQSAVDCWAERVQCSLLTENQSLSARAELTVHLFCRNSDGELVHVERAVTLSETLGVQQTEQEITSTLMCVPRSLRAQVRSDGQVELSLECRLQGELYEIRRLAVCTDAAAQEGEEKHISALTLVFARKGESLWEIAKHYRAPVAAIQKENALSTDTVPEERMLFVTR